MKTSPTLRGYSSAGRASDLHSEGRRFDPCCLHQTLSKNVVRFFLKMAKKAVAERERVMHIAPSLGSALSPNPQKFGLASKKLKKVFSSIDRTEQL